MSSAEWEDECCRVREWVLQSERMTAATAVSEWELQQHHTNTEEWDHLPKKSAVLSENEPCILPKTPTLQHSSSHSAELILSLCRTHSLTLHSLQDSFVARQPHRSDKTGRFSGRRPHRCHNAGLFFERRPYFLYVRIVLLQCCCSAVWKRALYLEDDPIDETMQGFFSEDDPIPSMYVWYFCSIVWKRALYSTKKSWNSWKKARHSAKEPSAQEWRNRTPDATRNTLQHTLQHTATHWNTLKSHSKRHGLSFCGLVGIIIVLIVPQKWNYLYYWYRWVSLLALYTWI